MSESREKLIAGYFPVIHSSYLDFIETDAAAPVGIFGRDVLAPRFNYLRKDIRALEPEQSLALISGLGRSARIITELSLETTMRANDLIMPDDDISRSLAKEFSVSPQFVPVFLRWDRHNSVQESVVSPDRVVTSPADDPFIKLLYEEASKSPNWWRHVAAAVYDTTNEAPNMAHNSSMPTEFSSSIDSDPRITTRRGEEIDRSIDIHAEAKLIAEYARKGKSTEGKSIFTTTFPCANCAKLIAESGFSQCYFIEGYATLDGQSILKSFGVEIIKVDITVPPTNPQRLRPYPS